MRSIDIHTNIVIGESGQREVRADWFMMQHFSWEDRTELRALPLLYLHALLFGLQDRIVKRLAEYEPDALATFEHAAERGSMARLRDDEDDCGDDRWYLPMPWLKNYDRLAEVVLEKERDEIAQLVAGRAA